MPDLRSPDTVAKRSESIFNSRIQAFDFRSGPWSVVALLSFTDPEVLDCQLAARGYQLIEPTLVMGLTLSGRSLNDAPYISRESLDNWLVAYHDLKASGEQPSAIHRQILTKIQSETLFVLLVKSSDNESVKAFRHEIVHPQFRRI